MIIDTYNKQCNRTERQILESQKQNEDTMYPNCVYVRNWPVYNNHLTNKSCISRSLGWPVYTNLTSFGICFKNVHPTVIHVIWIVLWIHIFLSANSTTGVTQMSCTICFDQCLPPLRMQIPYNFKCETIFIANDFMHRHLLFVGIVFSSRLVEKKTIAWSTINHAPPTWMLSILILTIASNTRFKYY